MTRKTLFVLLGTLVVLAVLIAVGQRSRAPQTSTGELFAPALADTLDNVERITVAKAGGETVATIERRDDGWVVAEKDGYPADVAKLGQSLRALAEARILEEKTSNPELYDRLGVEDVTADDAGGLAITLGDSSPALILGNPEGSQYRYARRAGDATSYLIDKNPELSRETAQWLDTAIIDVRGERVREVTITHPDGEVVSLSKAEAAAANYDVANVPEGRELLYPGVANVVGNALRELDLEDVEPAGTEPVERPVIVEFRTFDGLVVRATGSERDDESWVSFEASFDPEGAVTAPADAADGGDDEAGEAVGGVPNADDPAEVDPAAEAERINTRVRGWRYRIASFQYDQMTRRMADLLKPPA
jgi:hypothetical protein